MDHGARQVFGGDWTEQKLDCISWYLTAYTTALKFQPFRTVYIDAFAGTGYRERREEQGDDLPLMPELAEEEPQRFLEGSVIRALKVQPKFDEYVLIEKHEGRFQELSKLKSQFPDHSISVENEDANRFLLEYTRDTNWAGTRAALFLDPFGMDVGWHTVEAIAATHAIDLWYLFPLVGVTRVLRKDGQIPQAWQRRLDFLFGTHDWRVAFYRVEPELTLFGPEETTQKIGGSEAITEFLLKRLRTTFPAVASNPLVLRNSGGIPLFLLCFAAATLSKRGQDIALRIAEHILGKRAKHG